MSLTDLYDNLCDYYATDEQIVATDCTKDTHSIPTRPVPY